MTSFEYNKIGIQLTFIKTKLNDREGKGECSKFLVSLYQEMTTSAKKLCIKKGDGGYEKGKKGNYPGMVAATLFVFIRPKSTHSYAGGENVTGNSGLVCLLFGLKLDVKAAEKTEVSNLLRSLEDLTGV